MSRRNCTRAASSALGKLTINRNIGSGGKGLGAKRPWFLLLLLTTVAPAIAQNVNVLTYHNDNARTGQDLKEASTNLVPSTVNSKSFGKLFVLPADGKVDAEPLYMSGVAIPGRGTHNVLFVATEHDSVYAYDANTEAKL